MTESVERNASVYSITHIDSNRKYIGQTIKKPNIRWKEHIMSSNLEFKHRRYHIHRAIAKYGVDAFVFDVLWQGKCTQIELDSFEKFFIAFWNSMNNGFNENAGGGGNAGFKMPKHAIEKVVASTTGKRRTPDQRARISESKKGKPNGHQGMKRSSQTCQNISSAKLGKKSTPEARLAYSKAQIGNKNAQGNKGNQGRKASQESRLKMREAQQKRRVRERLAKELNNGNVSS